MLVPFALDIIPGKQALVNDPVVITHMIRKLDWSDTSPERPHRAEAVSHNARAYHRTL